MNARIVFAGLVAAVLVPSTGAADSGKNAAVCKDTRLVTSHLMRSVKRAIVNKRDFKLSVTRVQSIRRPLTAYETGLENGVGCIFRIVGSITARDVNGAVDEYVMHADIVHIPHGPAPNIFAFDLVKEAPKVASAKK